MGMGGSDKAAKEAQRAEDARRAAIQQTTGQINQVFNDPAREGQYADFLAATRRFLTDDLNRKQSDTLRNSKFALSRSGLAGGSAQVDVGRDIGEAYQRGLVETDRRSQGAEASLRDADEQARLNLIAMAQSGLDATTGTTRAAAALRNNLQAGRAGATVDGIGDIFGSFTDAYKRSVEQAELLRGRKYGLDALYGRY